MLPFAGLLFDKDGTLVDFDPTWGRATAAVVRRLSGGDADLAARLAALVDLDMVRQRLAPTSVLVGGTMAEVAAAWAGALRRDGDPALGDAIDALFADETLAALTPLDDPAAILGGLRREGMRLGVATNDSEVSAREQVRRLGLDGVLDFVAGYDSGYGGKPEPGMVLAFAQAIGVAPAHVAMIGDTPHDLVAGRAAGAATIAVLSGPTDRALLEPLADHIISSIAALPELLRRIA